MENLEPLCTTGGNENAAAAMENSVVVPQKIKHKIAKGSSNCTSGYILKRTESRDFRYLYK